RLTDRAQGRALAFELIWRVAVNVGLGPHLHGVPQRAGLVDAFEPRHAVKGRRDEDDDELGTALALGRCAPLVGDASAPEQRLLHRPAITDPVYVAPQLAEVESAFGLHRRGFLLARASGATATRR